MENWRLTDAALLQVVSAYASIERDAQVTHYATMLVRKRDPVTPYAEHAIAWAAARDGDEEAARVPAAEAWQVLPEASAATRASWATRWQVRAAS